jgi:hypothetical protein
MTVNSTYKQTTATSAEANKVTVTAPYRGVLNKIIVKQTSGTLAGFTVDVYDCDPDAPPDTDNKDVHQIIGRLTVAAASDTAASYQLNAAYLNREITSGDASLRPKGRITLVITPAGSLSKPFHIGITTVNDV